jgi:hypothetical protein
MDFNTSTTQTGEFSSEKIIVRQSSDLDPITGLIRYAVHTSTRVQLGTEYVYGPWESHEVDLVPQVVAVILGRSAGTMATAMTMAQLTQLGTDYANFLKLIVDYCQNPPQQSELEALGLVEPPIDPPIPES